MDIEIEEQGTVYLTTKEVAALLRVKERKVYDLAAAGEIPHRRITGKLLFPKGEITAWIEGEEAAPVQERPPVLAGSHDPLLGWAVRESACGLAILTDGSLAGLRTFLDRRAALTGLHLPEPDGAWNAKTVAQEGATNAVLLGWAVRARGLLLAPSIAGEITSFADIAGRKVVMRQPGAGAAALMDRLLAQHDLSREDVDAVEGFARTESDAAVAVTAGEADAALGIAAMARQFNLAFLPLVTERFDLLVDRRAYFGEPVQTLFRFARTAAFAKKAAQMGGYDIEELGAVRWLSP